MPQPDEHAPRLRDVDDLLRDLSPGAPSIRDFFGSLRRLTRAREVDGLDAAMFGMGKKAELKNALERATAALAGSDVTEIGRAYDDLRFAAYEADPENAEARALLVDLERHRSDVAGRQFANACRTCVRCGGGDMAVSEAFRFTKLELPRGAPAEARMRAESPPLRMWVCRACGVTELVVDDLTALDEPIFLATARVPPSPRGPFR